MLWLKELNPKTLTDRWNQAPIDFCLCRGLQKTTLAVPSCSPEQPFLPPCSTHSCFFCVCFPPFTQCQLFQSFFHLTPTTSSFFSFSDFNFLPFFLPSSILLYFCLIFLYLLLLSASSHSSEEFGDILIVCYYFAAFWAFLVSSSIPLAFVLPAQHICPFGPFLLPWLFLCLLPTQHCPFTPLVHSAQAVLWVLVWGWVCRVLHMSHTQDGGGWICWPTTR